MGVEPEDETLVWRSAQCDQGTEVSESSVEGPVGWLLNLDKADAPVAVLVEMVDGQFRGLRTVFVDVGDWPIGGAGAGIDAGDALTMCFHECHEFWPAMGGADDQVVAVLHEAF